MCRTRPRSREERSGCCLFSWGGSFPPFLFPPSPLPWERVWARRQELSLLPAWRTAGDRAAGRSLGPGRPQPRRSAAAEGAEVGLRCPLEGAGRLPQRFSQPPRRFSQPPRRLGNGAGWCRAEGDFGPPTKQRGAVNGRCRPSPCPLCLCWAAGAPVFLRVVTGISDFSCSRGEVSSPCSVHLSYCNIISYCCMKVISKC